MPEKQATDKVVAQIRPTVLAPSWRKSTIVNLVGLLVRSMRQILNSAQRVCCVSPDRFLWVSYGRAFQRRHSRTSRSSQVAQPANGAVSNRIIIRYSNVPYKGGQHGVQGQLRTVPYHNLAEEACGGF